MISACCDEDPKKRPTLQEILEQLKELEKKENIKEVLTKHIKKVSMNKLDIIYQLGPIYSDFWVHATNNKISPFSFTTFENIVPYFVDWLDKEHNLSLKNEDLEDFFNSSFAQNIQIDKNKFSVQAYRQFTHYIDSIIPFLNHNQVKKFYTLFFFFFIYFIYFFW